MFNIDVHLLFFPHKFLTQSNLSYIGTIPDFQFYLEDSDSTTLLGEKKQFYSCLKHKKWDLTKELIEYSDQNVLILALSMLNFTKESFFFQYSLQATTNRLQQYFLNPFNAPSCSLSGYIYNIYYSHYMNHYDIFTVNHEYGYPTKLVSRIEHQFTSFTEYTNPTKTFASAFGHKHGQQHYKESIPDLVCLETNSLTYFQGCYYHNHYENCLINKNATATTMSRNNKTFKEENDLFFSKIQNLMLNHESINEVHIVWECQFRDQMKKNPELIAFLRDVYCPLHPLQRLRARDAMRGPYCESYALRWSNECFPDEVLYSVDTNGLFSYCCINNPFMVGPYEIIIGKDISLLSVINNCICYKGQSVMGLILISMLPPPDLKYPFLPYRLKTGLCVYPLCKLCAESALPLCTHSDNERSLTGCYTISEINYSLSLNYKILAIHEAYIYTKSDYILKDFVKELNFLKTKYSDCLSHLSSTEEKERYCEFLNDELQFKKKLTINNVKPNNLKRNWYKLAVNCFFGKFSQRSDNDTTVFVNSQKQLNDIFFSANEIKDFNCINEKICLLTIGRQKLEILPDRKHNVTIGSQITAYARIFIHEYILLLANVANCKLYQVNCDNLVFSLPSNQSLPSFLIFSHAVGHFKHQYSGKIMSYFALGPKQYGLTYQGPQNTSIGINHLCGFNLKSTLTNLTPNSLEHLLKAYEQNKKMYEELQQTRKKMNLQKLTVEKFSRKFILSNNVTNKRIINGKTERLETLPYGYKAHNFLQVPQNSQST